MFCKLEIVQKCNVAEQVAKQSSLVYSNVPSVIAIVKQITLNNIFAMERENKKFSNYLFRYAKKYTISKY